MSENITDNETENTELVALQMDCCSDELSPSQLTAYSKACQERDDVINTLTDLINTYGNASEHNHFIPDSFQVYQLTRDLSQPTPTQNNLQTNNNNYVRYNNNNNVNDETSYDNPEYLMESFGSTNSYFMPITQAQGDVQKINQKENQSTTYTILESCEGNEDNIAIVPTINNSINTTANYRQIVPNTRVSKQLIVDKHRHRWGGGGDRGSHIVTEVNTSSQTANNDGKMYPSLVVLAKPKLQKGNEPDRSVLNTSIISLLKLDHVQFTQWLFHHKLIRLNQKCKTHPQVPLNLEIVSDTKIGMDDGSYVWCGPCCPSTFLSVYHGSIFNSKLHPHIIIKLIYHWICQTNVNNILRWVVGVHSEYIRDFYACLRSICANAIDNKMPMLGEYNQQIELGIVSLGGKNPSSGNGSQRSHNIKVEILGVLDPVRKYIRLYAVEPESDDLQHSKILLILPKWVSKDCRLLCDLTVNKNELHKMGYQYIVQTTKLSGNANRCNANIMNYLHNNVSPMFRNTLWKLPRDIIQQFLDELVWREMFDTSPELTFNTIVKHIGEKIQANAKIKPCELITKMSPNQKQKLIQLLGEYSKQFTLALNEGSSNDIRRFINWEHIKNVLNEMGPVIRSAGNWRRRWSDIKRKVRVKLRNLPAKNINNNISHLSAMDIKIQHLINMHL